MTSHRAENLTRARAGRIVSAMLIGHGALEPAPGYAVVPEHVVRAVLRELGEDELLRVRLDREFRRLEAGQPTLADMLSSELHGIDEAAGQALVYYLFLTVCAAFREAFGARLGEVGDRDLDRAIETLLADGEVRSQTCIAGSYSQDIVALWQPALMRLVNAEIDASEDAAQVEPVLQILLVLVVALTRAVTGPGSPLASGRLRLSR
jgi:hypothetical protein